MASEEFRLMRGRQLRAARDSVRWSPEDLAEQSRVAVTTIRDAEAEDGPVLVTAAEARAVQLALERAGAAFLPQDGGGAGVRSAKPSHAPDEGLRPDQLSSDNDG